MIQIELFSRKQVAIFSDAYNKADRAKELEEAKKLFPDATEGQTRFSQVEALLVEINTFTSDNVVEIYF